MKDGAVKDGVMMGIFGKFTEEAEQYARQHPQQGQEAGQAVERRAGPSDQQEQYMVLRPILGSLASLVRHA